MPVRTGLLLAALLGASPALATAPKAPAKASTPAAAPAAGECCTGGGDCAGASAGSHDGHEHSSGGLDPYASEENWREFVRRKFAEPPPEHQEPPDSDPFGFSVYRGVRPEPMGHQTLINGARMAIASLIVKDPPRMVGNYYLEALGRAGINPMRGSVPEVPGMTWLSFRPQGSKNLKTLTLVPSGQGTVILASVGNPEELLQQRPDLPDDFPLPPGSEPPAAIQQLEPGQSSRTASFLVRESTEEKVRAFFRRELPRRGFRAVAEYDALPGLETWQKGTSQLALSVKAYSEPDSVAVSLLWLEP